ncbi:ApaG domain [Akkermansiaceae bacterium]|nr:ApaG domain [Akkermansiaceae bacterium]MDB4748122.1 ApaG domain [Akkermansiaceae bacterium]
MAFPGLPGLRVEIEKVVFAPQLEAPPEKPFPFAYFIHIINESSETVTILARKWILRDTKGEVVVVEGAGVVGENPKLMPGQSFSYNSYHVVACDSKVAGAFFGVDSEEKRFCAKIPPFTLKCPFGQ